MTDLDARLTVAELDVLADCEQTISHGLQTFVEVGTALALIRDNRLWRTRYRTFEAYCAERWGIVDSRARQLIIAAQTVTTVTAEGLPAPANERQARELARVPESERADVWRAANEATDGKPTAAAIRAAANPDRPSATGEAGARLDAAATVSEAPTGVRPPVGAGETADGVDLAPSDASDTEPAWTPGADAAPDSGGQKTSESGVTPHDPDEFAAVLDRLVPDDNPHREWRRRFLDAISGVHAVMRFKPDDVAERADEVCIDELVRVFEQFDDYRTRVIEARISTLPDNVTPIRRAQ